MECSVRFVAELRETSKGYEQVGNVKPALCVRGRKVALAVINDDLWVRTIELPLPDHDKSGFVHYHGAPYEPKPFADRLLMSAKLANKPMTRRSKYILTSLDKADEDKLPEELLEPVEQERIYSENTPKERIKAAQRPSPPRDVTREYQGKLYAVQPEMPIAREESPTITVSSVSTGAKKAPKKVAKAPTKGSPPKKPIAAIKGAKPEVERGNLIKKLASEFKVTTQEFRVAVRATGMRAPYTEEKKVREAYKQGVKIVAKAKKK